MPLPQRKIVEELLRPPFGPYRDEEVLSTECESKAGKILVLKSFQLAYNDEIIGLDESEQPLGTGEVDTRQFRFRGILGIRSLVWLSQVGVKRVEAELNLRANTRSMCAGERPPNTITLEELFNRKNKFLGGPPEDGELELRLQIQGFRNFPALYMTSKLLPDGLLWHSKDRNRTYEVATMDVYTFQLSENFFWRYRLLALMTKIVGEGRTPLEKRTPEWFVSQYLERFAHPASDEHERLIYDSTDSDVDEGRTQLPRHPRRIHRRDILGLFAAQSEWFVTDNEVKRKRIFPFRPWNAFRKEVRKARWQAARNNVIWGWPIGRQNQPDLASEPGSEEGDDEDDEDDEDTRNMVERNPVIGKANEIVRRKIDKAKTRRTLPSARRDNEAGSSSSSSDELDPARAHAYMSDFSRESSSTASDSSDESVDERLLDFGELIPRQLSQVPALPGPDNRWWCPVPECGHMVDLQRLTRDDIKALSATTVFYLMEKKWRSIREDERAKKCFFEMVSKHYEDHFTDLGLRFVQTKGRTGIDSIRDKRRGPQAVVIVKEEVI
ncbi:uncharacterized protein F5891DRAFT_1147463 [Suillus fuscotomentosus]|uniref:Uncharacterized protein n=1 Tax=Suillus fuscotomentosus TaxID=1912939 RepID=A0AAD4E454_9AGAM|nr:uncharacterized protein F5891DRAFT_1147463 [Suillus fuscotomentosus]KAG1899242.1 hypothetical protein F5891DRAFT_1147463 [Suillus fuscotomentosus]